MTCSYSRRRILQTAGIAVAGAAAGCGGDSSADGDTDEPEDSPSSSEPTPAETTEEMQSPPSVDEFLSETGNYDSIVDMTGSDAVTVDVGVEANGAFYGFSPAAVRVDTGTTVTWEWTGQGGIHNVVARHGADFASEQQSGGDVTYQQSFDDPGTVLYVCVPHEGVGMKGAVIVE